MKKTGKEITLPKLELTAALIAARLQHFLHDALKFTIHSITLWTDSSITLNWINGQGKQCKPHVKSKVAEINNLTSACDWRHCDGKSNPADLLTRGIKSKDLVNSTLWKMGPHWLLQDESEWPSRKTFERTTAFITVNEKSTADVTENVIVIHRFSNINRLLHITASTQKEHFREEIASLQKTNKLPSDSKITSLNPKIIDGLLRATCRLPEGEFCTERNPIILPKRSYFSQLVVAEAHRKTFHGGVSNVLVHIRTKYWIIQARQLIKRVLQRCVICLRLHGKSATEPWTVLPTERVVTSRQFETTVVDFAGPLYVVSDSKESEKKVYIILFTCAAIRAIHLELVGDMSTNSWFKDDGSTLAKSWVTRQALIHKFLKCWRSEYLCQLRSIHHNKTEPSKSVKVGDVVLLHEDNKPRLFWRLAVVHQTNQGRDGLVRACDVRLQDQKILKRPIQLHIHWKYQPRGGSSVAWLAASSTAHNPWLNSFSPTPGEGLDQYVLLVIEAENK
ncbi:uncharacterized protein LOC142224836 [Haematobia irritans]|uniref:uncharacterized protein LOC142224836 n=1 Tax=Haematobia irritans TaxID=7368 RepID=UPI003F4FD564